MRKLSHPEVIDDQERNGCDVLYVFFAPAVVLAKLGSYRPGCLGFTFRIASGFGYPDITTDFHPSVLIRL
jgi:hypothetical protein